MIDALRCEGQRRFNVIQLEVRQLGHDLRMRISRSQQIEHIDHADSQAPYAGSPPKLPRFGRDALQEIAHATNITTSGNPGEQSHFNRCTESIRVSVAGFPRTLGTMNIHLTRAALVAGLFILAANNASADGWRSANSSCGSLRDRQSSQTDGSAYNGDSKGSVDVMMDSRGGSSVSVTLGNDPEDRATMDRHNSARCNEPAQGTRRFMRSVR
jgi:hypothetical protein